MRVGFLFHKDPCRLAAGADLVRLRALALGLHGLGVEVTVVAPVQAPGRLGILPVEPLAVLTQRDRFDVLKACYHFSLELLGDYDAPLVCRLVRVVDQQLPERDAHFRQRLLACQELARERALGIICNNRLNTRRWREFHGTRQRTAVIPTGCPEVLPPPGADPYAPGPPPVLFLGSVAAPRMAEMLSEAAELLADAAVIHLVGANKTGLYGGARQITPRIVQHGELPEERTWDYLRGARLGLALAAGPDPFDNDLSKILAYLRAGLPVLGEERLANAGLFLRRGFGATFRYGDVHHLVEQVRRMLTPSWETAMSARRTATIAWIARGHGWRRRAVALARFLQKLTRGEG